MDKSREEPIYPEEIELMVDTRSVPNQHGGGFKHYNQTNDSMVSGCSLSGTGPTITDGLPQIPQTPQQQPTPYDPNLQQIVDACSQARLIAQGAIIQPHTANANMEQYHKKHVILGLGQVFLAAISLLLALFWVAAKPSIVKVEKGPLFICALVFTVTGVTGIKGRSGRKRLALIRCMIFSVVSAAFAVVVFAQNLMGVYEKDYYQLETQRDCSNGPKCVYKERVTSVLNHKRYALYCSGVVVCLAEFIVATTQLSYCCIMTMSYQINNVYYVVAKDMIGDQQQPEVDRQQLSDTVQQTDLDNDDGDGGEEETATHL